MVSFENFVKSMPPSLSELKVTPSFCFAFKIPDDVTATTLDIRIVSAFTLMRTFQTMLPTNRMISVLHRM